MPLLRAALDAPAIVGEALGPDVARGVAWVASDDLASADVVAPLFGGYRRRQGDDSRRFFAALWVELAALRAEVSALSQDGPRSEYEAAFRRRQELQSLAFARSWARTTR